MNIIKEILEMKLDVFKRFIYVLLYPKWEKYFGNEMTFKKAKASIVQIGNEKSVGRVTIAIGSTTFYFEGFPEVECYKNKGGEDCIKKTWEYGGWERKLPE